MWWGGRRWWWWWWPAGIAQPTSVEAVLQHVGRDASRIRVSSHQGRARWWQQARLVINSGDKTARMHPRQKSPGGAVQHFGSARNVELVVSWPRGERDAGQLVARGSRGLQLGATGVDGVVWMELCEWSHGGGRAGPGPAQIRRSTGTTNNRGEFSCGLWRRRGALNRLGLLTDRGKEGPFDGL